MDNPEKYFNKRQASAYLTETLGLAVAEKTLSKMITVGGGPKYRKFGRRVVYTLTDLNDWANSKLSVAVNNSSQWRQ